MFGALTIPRKLLVAVSVVLISVYAGYQLANPDSLKTIALMTGLAGMLVLPLMIRHYHPLMLISLNSNIVFNFLPGNLSLWMILAISGIIIVMLNRCLHKHESSLHVPAISWALVVMVIVTLLTAVLTDSLGFRFTGSNLMGGKRYYFILAAVFVYFILVSKAIPRDQAKLYVFLWLLPSISSVISNLVYALGPSFYFLFNFLSVDVVRHQMGSETLGLSAGISRWSGMASLSLNMLVMILMLYGFRGLCDLRRPWRQLLLVAVVIATLMSGFRTNFVFMVLVIGLVFYMEGHHRNPLVLSGLLVAAILFSMLLPFAHLLPQVAQRAISVIPIAKVDAAVAWDAEATKQWRLDMWNLLWPEIPKYLIVGKGYGIDATEQYLLMETVKRGKAATWEVSMLHGDFHNGPLSVIIPFGIFGAYHHPGTRTSGRRIRRSVGLRPVRRQREIGSDPTVEADAETNHGAEIE